MSQHCSSEITLRVGPPVADGELTALFAAAWPDGGDKGDYRSVLARSLTYVCAYAGERLVGFVNVAWDGGGHALLLDTTVHPAFRRRGIGTSLVRRAAETARDRGAEWLHVDYEPHLESFHRQCGFKPTRAGLLALQPRDA